MSKSMHAAIVIFCLAYFLIVSIFLFRNGSWFSPDQFFAAALIITLILGRFKQFVRDWSTPIILFLGYDYMRGLVPKLSLQVHIFPMINFDKNIFGFVPTIQLQNLLFTPGQIRWYDYLGTILYMAHFIVPMVVAFLFWINNKQYFRSYSLGILLLSYMAFITYIVFPAMPPWMAGQQGFIPPVQKIMDQVFLTFTRSWDLPSFYKVVGANLVAAVPSLHAAYPLLTFLFVRKRFRRLGFLVIMYVLAVWWTIVYLGEHYVFDIVVGASYAIFVFAVINYYQQIKKLLVRMKLNLILR